MRAIVFDQFSALPQLRTIDSSTPDGLMRTLWGRGTLSSLLLSDSQSQQAKCHFCVVYSEGPTEHKSPPYHLRTAADHFQTVPIRQVGFME